MMIARVFLLLLTVALATSLRPADARAHASLLQSDPVEGAVLASPPAHMSLRFNEPVAPTVIRIIDPRGREIAPASVLARNETIEIVVGAPVADGTSLMSWRVISADGHPVGGTIAFSVGHPSSNDGAVDVNDHAVASLIWVTRLMIYLGMLTGVGGVFFRAWLDPSASRKDWVAGTLRGLILAGIGGAILAFGLQGLDALGLPLRSLIERNVWATSWGTTYATSLVFGGGAMIAALLAGVSVSDAWARIWSLAGVLGAALSLASSGHASTADPQGLTRMLVIVHGLGIIYWSGALLPLLGAATGDRAAFATLLRRFSWSAIPVVVALILAGGGLAVIQLGKPESLWTTAYGFVLLAKLAAVAALLGLALLNHQWLMPAVEGARFPSVLWLRRSMGAEMLLIVLVLGIAGLWRFTTPPRTLILANAQPAFVHIHSEKAMTNLSVTPGHVGSVSASMTFLSGDFGPLEPQEVSLSFARPEAGIEPIRRVAERGADGAWHAGPFVLPQSGAWQVRVDVLISDFDKVILTETITIRR